MAPHPESSARRVFTVAPMPPEKCAYALARYSRSPDSIADSIEWVKTHNSEKFLESFYFQYGHASIADLGHTVLCFEGISELAATEIEDEQLWDGQARSSRYQDFSKSGVITPPEFTADEAALYRDTSAQMLSAYKRIHDRVFEHLVEKLPKPADMKEDAYKRNIAARAFDVARYVLVLGIPTGVGQVVSIRTLERQIRRLKASDFAEIRELADEVGAACAAEPACKWRDDLDTEAIAPTLARHVEVDEHLRTCRADLRLWAEQNLPDALPNGVEAVDLLRPADAVSDIVATLLYPVTKRSYRDLYDIAASWSAARRSEVIDVALKSKTRRDELTRSFRGGVFVYDIVMDIGAYRDLHRHRRCQQFRQEYTTDLGYSTPAAISDGGLEQVYANALELSRVAVSRLPQPAAQYMIPFGCRSRFLFKMDFAEAEYVARLRSGVKGHFSYRDIAWKMKEKMVELEPELGRLIEATPPWVEDPLKR